MPEKSQGRSRKRSLLARHFVDLGRLRGGVRVELSYWQILMLIASSFLATLLLIEYQFQSLPDFAVGEISDRTIEAPEEFSIIDEAATEEAREAIVETVPLVFNFELPLTNQQISRLRRGFAAARELIAQERERIQTSDPDSVPIKALDGLKPLLEERLPRFAEGNVIEIFLKYSFSEELENQLVNLLAEAMEYPGVVELSGSLVHLQERGFTIHDVLTGQDRTLSDWTDLRDVQQARDVLIQREHELTLVDAEEKRKLLSFLGEFVIQNTVLDSAKTDANELKAKNETPEVFLQVKKGRTIVRRGDAITQQTLDQLNRLKELEQQESWTGRIFGVFVIVSFFLLVLWLYLQIHQDEKRRKGPDFILMVLLLVVGILFARAFFALAEIVAGSLNLESLQDPFHFYLVAPFAMGAILTILLLGVNASIFFSLVFSIFVGVFAGELSVMLFVLTGSIAAIHALRQYRERSAIVRAGMIIGAVNVLIALALQLYSSQGEFQWTQFMVRTVAGVISGLSSAMFASLFLPVLESLFDLTTDIRLLELSNLNGPLLRRLALEAPGTYHHSITVGTLAEAGAEEIGANGLLTRVGAYYHDIGKLKHPEYYIENQVFTGNKHESLAPSMSTLILTAHVKDGLAIAEEVGLGPKVRDLIPQHHGTRIMTYFFQKAREVAEEKGQSVNENDFRYPGPKPQFKEAAILMLADQVEAAARTLQEPSPGQIRSLIQRLTQSTIRDGQFDECDITLKELSKVGAAFERVLNGMYHHRIEYPGFEFNKRIEDRQPENQRIQ